ncbi:MAG: alanine--tRNA ligase [Eubacteriales bacterium]|nr:alanine--tRNA ligase [Eubacteriales bacterium]
MEKTGLNKLREDFLSFFESKGHYRRESFSLIPENDKSLLLINAGMAPLKPYFGGLKTPPSKRMTTCQKCIRTGDIDNVGYTARHGTFFEMLGNFSFGDYFKKDAIAWGWEFSTKVLKLPEDKLWITIYEDDEEAHDLWHDMIGLPEERIVRLGKKDNFWEIGTGPCGPCSELHFDRGEKYGCGSPDCKPGCECDRYVEYWNLVFTQFNKEEDGSYTNLPHPNIDTGLGLERLACIMQETNSIFDVDTIQYVLNQVVKVSGVEYKDGEVSTDVSIRIITDHLRSMTFMISDGIIPGNEGREYVLRRLIRRAAIHGRKLGIKGPFLSKLCDKVVDTSIGAYPELEKRRLMISRVVHSEEEKFAATIDQGMRIIDEYIADMVIAGTKVLTGEKAFKLHDTYGFPIDLTREILEEKSYGVDIDGFNSEMELQKERSRTEQEMEGEGWKDKSVEFIYKGETEFLGYDATESISTVEALIINNETIREVSEGDKCYIILDKTPFYAESGGQVADDGYIYNEKGGIARVDNVIKFEKVFAHQCEIVEGSFSEGEKVDAMINVPHRNMTAANHSATHMLHKALQEVLGDHVKQSGSRVDRFGLRFDFTHFEAMTGEEIEKVEEIINNNIRTFLPVKTQVMNIKDAENEGATALFGEKYGENVRVVSVGEFSKEFCGGTHVQNSGEIGAFKIVSESGVASGIRRIEAITSQAIRHRYNESENLLDKTAEILKSKRDVLIDKATALMEENKALKKEIEELKKAEMSSGLGALIDEAKSINGVKLITKQFEDYSINDLRAISDDIKASNKNIAMVFATLSGGKVTFLVSLTDDLVEKGMHAGKMIKEIAAVAGGGGGGKADMAQAGAKDTSKVYASFSRAEELL